MDLSKEHVLNEWHCSECQALDGHTETCVKFQQHFFNLTREEGRRIIHKRTKQEKPKKTMAHRLHIPRIREVIQLAEPWTFTLYDEYRNDKLIKMIEPTHKSKGWGSTQKSWTVTLPAKFELTVERLYIRQNQAAYDSVTFACPYNGKRVRFWVKLADANTMVILDDHERVT